MQEDLEREMASEDQNMPLVKHYDQRDYNGMFDYNKEDELLLIKNIILGNNCFVASTVNCVMFAHMK